VSVVVGQVDQCAGSAAGETRTRSGRIPVKPCFAFCINDEPKSRMTVLDEKNKALEEEIRRLRAERLRLERDNPGHAKRD
jgi:hypothetical protein